MAKTKLQEDTGRRVPGMKVVARVVLYNASKMSYVARKRIAAWLNK